MFSLSKAITTHKSKFNLRLNSTLIGVKKKFFGLRFVLSPGRLSCDNVDDSEVGVHCIVALTEKRPSFHQVAAMEKQKN